jgi:hypothetical protein
MRFKNPILGAFAGIVLAACVFVLVIRHLDNQEQGTLEAAGARENTSVSAQNELDLIRCPPAGSPMLQATGPDVGHHRVLLDWKASVPSKDPKAQIIGYCLYRSREQGAAKKNPRCADCEQINTVPIRGTRCRDDIVQDDKTYYYVSVAIARNRQMSSASDEAPAPIPKGGKTVESSSAAAYPPCRVPAGSNGPGGPS